MHGVRRRRPRARASGAATLKSTAERSTGYQIAVGTILGTRVRVAPARPTAPRARASLAVSALRGLVAVHRDAGVAREEARPSRSTRAPGCRND
jgi:hypothetical protein